MPKLAGTGQALVLSPEQLQTLMDAAPTPAHRLLWAIMRFTGSRVTETLHLTFQALHASHVTYTARTTKTRSTRSVPSDARLRQEIDLYKAWWANHYRKAPRSSDLVFPGRNPGEPLTRQAADLALRQTFKRLGFPDGISLHSFRRSLATNMNAAGVPAPTIQSFTGHKNLSQLIAYIEIPQKTAMDALAFV